MIGRPKREDIILVVKNDKNKIELSELSDHAWSKAETPKANLFPAHIVNVLVESYYRKVTREGKPISDTVSIVGLVVEETYFLIVTFETWDVFLRMLLRVHLSSVD